MIPSSSEFSPRVTWITRSFLDYRVPVFQALDELVGHRLCVVFSRDQVPERTSRKIQQVLGPRAIAEAGEWRWGPEDKQGHANSRVSIRIPRGLGKVVKATRPDVLIADGFFKWTIPALIHRLATGCPLVICYERTFHTERNAQWYRTAYRRMVLRYVDAMCCNGMLCLEYTRRLGMPRSRITTGHMAADTDNLGWLAAGITETRRWEIRQSWGAQGMVFLYVGRMIPGKGINYLLDAWGMLERSMPGQASLVLVGSGSHEVSLREQAQRLGLTGIRFAGAVDYDDLAPYYAAADAFVIPTLEDNWSLVVPEAMACGLPILCSRYNGCWPELVQEDRNGWVFDPLNGQDLFGCLRRCVDAKDRLKTMGEQSKVIIREHSPGRAAQSILAACRIAVSRRGPRS